MKIKKLKEREFISKVDDNINIYFSTALNNINYKKDTIDGKENIKKLNELFNLQKIYYLNQTHSDIVIDATCEEFYGDKDGDSIITKNKNLAIGVFTADCVPVIIYDKEKLVVAAVHSGWKGTFNEIVKKTCFIMKDKYNCESLNIIIGPHIKSCCYEVSDELQQKFIEKFGEDVCNNRMLNLENCIKNELEKISFIKCIESVNVCTYCNSDLEMHSYRKLKEKAGRLFSFIFIK
ncbi:peptidoglycan editing factor PgeF [Clostridium tarantellae]|uniref:Purine nucleoside phosphorylase n=1 Tax=Clostridium tarantellae TaxID=39493 RepID=A0A6I1MG04_9CLOT|nr:peptidoglycan editing factor PgeF [Clostridium tarantellae]MPQ42466.1 peptidoglycan editing factor PgeF [Clostridium tarantellae]